MVKSDLQDTPLLFVELFSYVVCLSTVWRNVLSFKNVFNLFTAMMSFENNR